MLRTSVRISRGCYPLIRSRARARIGVVELGQPHPDSNLADDANKSIAGYYVDIDAGFVVMQILARARPFGTTFLRDAILLRIQCGDGTE